MIEITRQLAKQLRVVLKKALGKTKPFVKLIAGQDGLRVQAQSSLHAVEYHDPEPRGQEELLVPFDVLEDVQGNKPEPVQLSRLNESTVTAKWTDKGVERNTPYPIPQDHGSFPTTPTQFTDGSPELWQALRDAANTTDANSTRYALGCIQFKEGRVNATDGRQLYSHSGFDFGFQEEVLFKASKILGSADLLDGASLQVGRTEQSIAFRLGHWTFHCGIEPDARFPRSQDVIPATFGASTKLQLNPADAKFFAEHAARIPVDSINSTVTLELNGSVVVRGKAEHSQPMEIVLTNSRKSGHDVTLCSDRRFLLRAMEMGFQDIFLFGADNALLASDDNRSYVWMPVSKDGAVAASKDCLRLESPVATASRSRHVRSFPPTIVPMPTPPTPEQTATPRKVRKRRTGQAGAVQQALLLREQLRTAAGTLKELVRSLKTEARGRKSLQAALQSLKQLQAA